MIDNFVYIGFSYLTHLLSKLAGGKLVMALEGGFELTPLCDCVEACVRTLLADSTKDDDVSLLLKSSIESLPCETSNRSLNRIGRIQGRIKIHEFIYVSSISRLVHLYYKQKNT